MSFDLTFAIEAIPLILRGVGNTIFVTLLAFIGASMLGFMWEMLRRSHPIISPVIQFIIDAIRSTPVLAQIYFFFFVLPYYGIVLPAMVVGVFGLSFYYSGYMSEVFKAGINAIPRGQAEAGQSLGLSWIDTAIFVIAPQMLRNVAAPLGAYSVSILKTTPILAVIAVQEMFGIALDITSETYRFAEPMFVVGILFLVLALIAVALIERFERYLGVRSPSN
ncbi:MAG: ABC transporter permease subunit [Mesorhizobium sp.]|uniref:amino acid ABC transporter permease n=1 Tax=Mesorhizobium sp. TaxID=1871066 RepID=UPI000FE6DF62|nr:ABC transporter permease subunit [Mesorhizobium sp.]RWP56678.1 MAG: ABC transporter permease subunit [Mesorhizobium sp.]TIW69229.1 MAG: ABC transporter permease subunit [Mesorhizobium sp.]